MYQLTHRESVIRLADGAEIPADPLNSDYAEYLRWVEEGNTASPAEAAAHADLVKQARALALPVRQLALDVLSGLGLDCLAAGDTAGAVLCSAARTSIKDMGGLDLSSCETLDAMKQAYKTRWAEISLTFIDYPELRSQFNKALK